MDDRLDVFVMAFLVGCWVFIWLGYMETVLIHLAGIVATFRLSLWAFRHFERANDA